MRKTLDVSPSSSAPPPFLSSVCLRCAATANSDSIDRVLRPDIIRQMNRGTNRGTGGRARATPLDWEYGKICKPPVRPSVRAVASNGNRPVPAYPPAPGNARRSHQRRLDDIAVGRQENAERTARGSFSRMPRPPSRPSPTACNRVFFRAYVHIPRAPHRQPKLCQRDGDRLFSSDICE